MAEIDWTPDNLINDEQTTGSVSSDDREAAQDNHFYAAELLRALVECAYGIHSWEQSPPDDSNVVATASVELLDKKNLVQIIGLDMRGYFVQPKHKEERKPFLRRFGSRSRSDGSTSMQATLNVAGQQSSSSSRPFLRKLSTAFPSSRSASCDQISNDGSISSPVSSNNDIQYASSPISPIQTHYETLENLLTEISPAFRQKQQQILEAKLFQLSEQR